MDKTMVRFATFLAVLLACVSNASAGPISWVNWTSMTTGVPGSATGTLAVDGTSVEVNYSGEVYFGQTSTGMFLWTPSTSYLSTAVPNLPDTPGVIALLGGSTMRNTLTFSRPVVNPVIAVTSIGRPNVTVDYAFDGAFVILSSGTGFFDSGNMLLAGTNILRSNEGNGVIQFPGIHSQISWTVPQQEDFGGFQVGVAGIADVTPGGQDFPGDSPGMPEPGTMSLLMTGTAGLLAYRFRFGRRSRG